MALDHGSYHFVSAPGAVELVTHETRRRYFALDGNSGPHRLHIVTTGPLNDPVAVALCLPLTLQAWLLPDGTVMLGYAGLPSDAQSLPATAGVIPAFEPDQVGLGAALVWCVWCDWSKE